MKYSLLKVQVQTWISDNLVLGGMTFNTTLKYEVASEHFRHDPFMTVLASGWDVCNDCPQPEPQEGLNILCSCAFQEIVFDIIDTDKWK